MDADWWRQAAVYQIYPRSFADSNGDGIGDLPGITSRVRYLAGLGIDAVWLSPFYPSALADGGYDVDDHRAVDPRIGTLEQFDEMVATLHSAGLQVIVDIVPNHTSNRHAWFAEALRSPTGSYARDRYVFRRGEGVHGERPPTDWTAAFGGSAWEPVRDGEWYLHLFAPEQPDLNWANEDVRDDFRTTLRFWADRGVDGFRVDVANFLAKDMTEPLPNQAELTAGLGDGRHPYRDRDEVHEIYRSWRSVFNEYHPPRMGVAEAWEPAHRQIRYASKDGLGQAFNLELLAASWQRDEIRAAIEAVLDLAADGGPPTWVFSNHDVVRHASRFALPLGTDLKAWVSSDGLLPPADDAAGLRRARAATLIALALPGSTYLYQGEELGLPEVATLPRSVLQDPLFRRTGGAEKGRDGCRVPLPWTVAGPSFGFGPDGAHLPQPDWFGRFAAEAQAGVPDSTLTLYTRALALRWQLQTGDELRWAGPGVHFVRPNGWTSITNFGPSAIALPAGELLLASEPLEGNLLPPDTTAWLQA